MYTIAAIATPHAAGGISVIRISGDSAVSVAQTCFRSVTGKSLSEMPGYTCAYGKFCDPSGAELDDGIATVFRAPHSYTGEDTVEFSCHGGMFVTQQNRSTPPALSRQNRANSPNGRFSPEK